MAVGEQRSIEVHPVTGIRMAAVASNIRYADRLDLVLLEIAERSTVAGVDPQNRSCAAPVQIAKPQSQTKRCESLTSNTEIAIVAMPAA